MVCREQMLCMQNTVHEFVMGVIPYMIAFPTRFKMNPNLLMRAWMMAHLYGAEYQAVVCLCGSSGDVAIRESLCPQYTSDRHDAKGLRTYHITGTSGGRRISRIVCVRIWYVGGPKDGPLAEG